MPHTLAEKILLAHTAAENISPGEIVMVRCDLVMADDVSGPVAFRQADVAAAAVQEAEIRVDVDEGEIVVDGERFETEPLPAFMQDMLSSGGLVSWSHERLDGQ